MSEQSAERSDGLVEVPFGEKPNETAILLLAAAEELDKDASVVRTTGSASFLVPQDVHDKAYPPKQTKSTRKRTESSEE